MTNDSRERELLAEIDRLRARIEDLTEQQAADTRDRAGNAACGEAEEALRESQANLGRAQEVGQMGWWQLDTRRNVLIWSDETYRIFGVPLGTPLTYELFLGAVHPDDRMLVDTRWKEAMRGLPYDIEHRIVADGQVKWVRERSYLEFDDAGRPLGGFGIAQDITERKQAEQERETTVEFLRLVNTAKGTRDMIRAAVEFCRQESGCEAVGVRLKEGDDYPYYESRGFPQEFLYTENTLCLRDEAGEPVLGSNGCPVYECMCGLVITGEPDASKPFFTKGGSFWTNSTTKLLEASTEDDRQTRTRNRCHAQGYESVALIPLRIGERRLGLIQLNDRRPGMFGLQLVEMWERLADQLAVALAKLQADEALRESEERLRLMSDNLPDSAVYQYARYPDGTTGFLHVSAGIERINGVSAETILSNPRALHDQVLPEYSQKLVEAEERSARELSDLDIDVQMRKPDGEVRWMRLRSRPRLLPDGRVVWDGVQTDVTEQKQAETELAQTRAQAEQRAAELESFLSAMTDGVVLFDAKADILMANEAALRLAGVPADTPLEERRQTYKLLGPGGEEIARADYPSMRALRGLDTRDARFRLVSKWKESLVSINGSPVRDSAGRVIGGTLSFRDVSKQAELERYREELYQRERHITEVLQGTLVPQEIPAELYGCRLAAKYQPALREAEVGGDFFDVFDLGHGRIGMIIGDVAGKGLKAAVRVTEARYTMRGYAYEDPSPSRVIARANRTLSKGSFEESGVLTTFLAIIDTTANTITYANAGHEPSLVIRGQDGCTELATTGIPLGITEDATYTEKSLELASGDRVVMITDGISEARSHGVMLFENHVLTEYLVANRASAPGDMIDGLLALATEHAGGHLQDDAVIVVFTAR